MLIDLLGVISLSFAIMTFTFHSVPYVAIRLGDYVARKEPITIDILLRVFSFFDFSNPLHICMRALFLVAFFSFLRISNLVPYTLADVRDPKGCYLRLSSVLSRGGYLGQFLLGMCRWPLRTPTPL